MFTGLDRTHAFGSMYEEEIETQQSDTPERREKSYGSFLR